MIKRDFYLHRMIHHMWNGEIKVITGIRRCGKSVLLFDLFYEYLLSQGPVFRRSTRKLPTFTFFSSTDVAYYMPCYP